MNFRRVLKWTAATISVLVVLLVLLGFTFFRTFYPHPLEPDFPATSDVTTAQQQDFDYFRANYFDLNRTFTPAALEQAQKRLAAYRGRAGRLSPAQFDLAIANVVALADNGHSRVHPTGLANRHTRIPCRTYRFADGYYVLRARQACTELLGAKIVRIEGRVIEDVADAMFRYFGGPRNHYDQFASPFFLESPALLKAAGLAFAADRLRLTVALRDGVERDVGIVAEPADQDGLQLFGTEYLSPQRQEGEAEDWKPLLAPDAALPVFLRDLAVPFRAEFTEEGRLYYAQFRSNADEPGHPIGPFVDQIRDDVLAKQPRIIVLDLRHDQGGNFLTTASLMKDLPHLTESLERVYVLTSAWTFSAGNVNLALLKEHGGDKVVVIGEPAGDRVRTWAEGGTLQLPHSGLRIGYSTGLHDYSGSCFGTPGCFWVMYFYPTHVSSFEPDVPVRYTFDDYVNLRDPAMDRALALALH
jgi:hypothetical protein